MHANALVAAAVAAKNAVLLLPAQLAAGFAAMAVTTSTEPLSVDLIVNTVGPRPVAMFFAVLGALWRWHRFRLSLHMGVSGVMFSMTLAFIIGDGEVPYADALTSKIAHESIPMMNGFLMGLFGLLFVTGVQDFMKAYREQKEGEA